MFLPEHIYILISVCTMRRQISCRWEWFEDKESILQFCILCTRLLLSSQDPRREVLHSLPAPGITRWLLKHNLLTQSPTHTQRKLEVRLCGTVWFTEGLFFLSFPWNHNLVERERVCHTSSSLHIPAFNITAITTQSRWTFLSLTVLVRGRGKNGGLVECVSECVGVLAVEHWAYWAFPRNERSPTKIQSIFLP